MLQRLGRAALLASLLVHSANAAAEPVAATSEVRRDPRGIKGISPFSEALKRGDTALLTRDLEAALLAYREALEKEPENALGHYRLGEVQILKDDLHEAEQAFSAGLRFVSPTNPALKAKLQFALADLRERQKAYDQRASNGPSTRPSRARKKTPTRSRPRAPSEREWSRPGRSSAPIPWP